MTFPIKLKPNLPRFSHDRKLLAIVSRKLEKRKEGASTIFFFNIGFEFLCSSKMKAAGHDLFYFILFC